MMIPRKIFIEIDFSSKKLVECGYSLYMNYPLVHRWRIGIYLFIAVVNFSCLRLEFYELARCIRDHPLIEGQFNFAP